MLNPNHMLPESDRPALLQHDIDALERLRGSYHGHADNAPMIEADHAILRVVEMTLRNQKQDLRTA
jgi:hypothetical protein